MSDTTSGDEPVPILMTVRDAVKFSGISRSTLYAMLSAGQIVAKKIGRSTMIVVASLRQAIDELKDF